MNDHAAIERAAASWLVRRSEPDWLEQDESELTAWLDESMAHKAAYWRLEHGYAQFDRLAALPRAEQRAQKPWRNVGRGMAMAATLAGVVLGGYLLVSTRDRPRAIQPATTEHSTGFGQVGTVALADGSTVELNSESRIRVFQDGERRLLWLDRGEAYFEVAHDRSRPFQVRAGAADVTVLGTKFDVSREAGKVKVSVLEGRVRLDRSARPATGSLTLAQGEVGVTDGTSIEATTLAARRIDDSLAWRNGMVKFDNTRLADAAAQFNRYNRQKLTIVDEKAQNLRIGGTFRLGNIHGFARLVNQAYGLKVRVSEEIETPAGN